MRKSHPFGDGLEGLEADSGISQTKEQQETMEFQLAIGFATCLAVESFPSEFARAFQFFFGGSNLRSKKKDSLTWEN